MPQSEAKFQVNQFTSGLVTDANPLSDTGPISTDEDNCELLFHGGRRRRRGAAIEPGGVAHTVTLTDTQKEDWAFDTFEWRAVANVPGLEFVVYQQGSKLWFYDKSDTTISTGLKSSSIDLTTFKISSATTTELENTRVSVATGKGVIFVAAATIEPFYVEYDPSTDTVSATQITISIRDFEEQSTTIGPQEEIQGSPTTGAHLYDLLNQGWYQRGPWLRDNGSTNRSEDPVVVLYFGHSDRNNTFPRKNTPWHVGKYLVPADTARESDTFISPQQIHSAPSGSTLAPFGHYVLEAFNKDRAQAVRDEYDLTLNHYLADLDELLVELEDERPVGTAFYAGRAWYILKNNVYFSQQLDQDSLDKSGKCYQEGDPTNEGESDIVATDGGLIPIPNMGRATGMAVMDNVLIVTADNGIWSISGTAGASFTAVDYTVNKLSNVSVQSPDSIVEAEGLIFLWGEDSLYVIQPGDVRDFPTLRDIGEQRITEFYKDIPQSSKRNCKGVYDPRNKIVYWMYKSSTDTNGVNKNRFQYDRFLNFSLKFSAFFPWSVDATSTHQIVGATVASGLLSTYELDTVTDSNLEDVFDSNGDLVQVNVQTVKEASNQLKVLALKTNQAIFGQFDNNSFLDWNEAGAGTDYSSYINTFYHIQDDYMAFMKAPYVYSYFKRTEEEQLANTVTAFSYDQIGTGGATFTSNFISEHNQTNNFYPHANATFAVGEDGVRYQLAQTNASGDVRFYDIDTGTNVTALDYTQTQIHTDIVNAGLTPTGGFVSGTTGDLTWYIVPETAYIVAVGGQASGVSTSKWIAYYRITDMTTLEFVGGYGGRVGDLAVQFSPEDKPDAINGLGWVNSGSTSLPSSDTRAATHNTIKYQYPMCVMYEGEARSTVFTFPSINSVILGQTSTENVTDHWRNREYDLDTDFGDNLFRVEDMTGGRDQTSRVFILPSSTGGSIYHKWYQADIDAHIAGTETTTDAFLKTYDSVYPNGFISSISVSHTLDSNDALGYTQSVSNPVTAVNGRFEDYPFTDETDNFDETAGTTTNFTQSPSAFPIYDDDILSPWLLIFPKIFGGTTDANKLEVKIKLYNPITKQAKTIDNIKGSYSSFGTDLSDPSGWTAQTAAVHWDRTDGTLTANIRLTKAGSTNLITAEIGTYEPQVEGVDSFFTYNASGITFIESSCLLNTRWDWANASSSGKISSDIQIYRGGRKQFHDDPDNPAPVGLPVYVSKTKTRGRGRALQLRFRSEQGKDFELYGWAVWGRKNTRF